MDKPIDRDELSSNNGEDGRPAHIAYKGQVFDVSGSRLWPDGLHQYHHKAGRDLTVAFDSAPHDESVFQRVPLVGQLVGDERKEIHPLLSFLLNLHTHPISVHFPIALILAAAGGWCVYTA